MAPPGDVLTNGMPLILDLNFELMVTPATRPGFHMPRAPGPPDNSEFQTYLNGLTSIATNGHVLGVPGADGTFPDGKTAIWVLQPLLSRPVSHLLVWPQFWVA
jgi:hypothetical protein